MREELIGIICWLVCSIIAFYKQQEVYPDGSENQIISCMFAFCLGPIWLFGAGIIQTLFKSWK